MLLAGFLLIVIGFLLSTNEKVAEWGVSHGHGRLWARILGKERALKVTKYFFGPLSILMGIGSAVTAYFIRNGD